MKNELLWLDDIRPAPNGYIHAHSVNEAKRIILEAEERGVTKFTLDLDHDLGDFAADGGDGVELVKWLAKTKRHYEIRLHTMNPVGRQNMQAIVDRYWFAERMITRKCTSLQYGEQVVFNLFSDIYKRKVPERGSVEFVDAVRKVVHVSYMEGYKECFGDIPFEDMLGVHNPDASVMRFENISGKSDMLIPE